VRLLRNARRTLRWRTSGVAVAAACALSVLAACSSGGNSSSSGAGSASGDILLGASQGLSGAYSGICGSEADSQKAWLNYVNAHGGINGRKIKFFLEDDAYSPARAASNARSLVTQDHVMGILGSCGTTTTTSLIPAAEALKVPYIAPYGATQSLYDPHKDYAFGLFPLYETQLGGLLQWAFPRYGKGSVMAVTYSTTASLFQTDVVDETKELGGQFLGNISYTLGQPSYTSIVLQLKQKNPDYVLFVGAAPDGANLVKEMARQGFKPGKKILSMGAMADPGYSGAAGAAANDISIAGDPFVLPSSPDAAKCAQALNISQAKLTSFEIFGCGSADIAVQAIKQLGSNVSAQSLAQLLNSHFSAKIPFLAGGEAKSAPDGILNHSLLPVTVNNGQLAIPAGTGLITTQAEPSP
jgi:branched-chain amino acid transport system substrate-binding protein